MQPKQDIGHETWRGFQWNHNNKKANENMFQALDIQNNKKDLVDNVAANKAFNSSNREGKKQSKLSLAKEKMNLK